MYALAQRGNTGMEPTNRRVFYASVALPPGRLMLRQDIGIVRRLLAEMGELDHLVSLHRPAHPIVPMKLTGAPLQVDLSLCHPSLHICTGPDGEMRSHKTIDNAWE